MSRPNRRKDEPRNADAPVLVVTGMKREAACVAAEGVLPICSGADVVKLRARLDALMQTEFSCVISFGLAGALDYALRPGDLMIADTVVGGARREIVDREGATFLERRNVTSAPGAPLRRAAHTQLSQMLAEGAATAGCKTVAGALVGVDQPAMDTTAKTHLRETMKAQAVDMESHLAIEFAEKRGLPFAVMRAISDPAARALPPLAANALTPEGDVDIIKVAREVIRAPQQIPGLIFAGLDSGAAFGALRRCGPLLRPLSRLVLADL